MAGPVLAHIYTHRTVPASIHHCGLSMAAIGPDLYYVRKVDDNRPALSIFLHYELPPLACVPSMYATIEETPEPSMAFSQDNEDLPSLDHLGSNATVEEVKGPEASPHDDEGLAPLPHATLMSGMMKKAQPSPEVLSQDDED